MQSVFPLLQSNFDLCNKKLSPDACEIRHQLVSAGEAGNDPDSAADDLCYQVMRCIFYEATFSQFTVFCFICFICSNVKNCRQLLNVLRVLQFTFYSSRLRSLIWVICWYYLVSSALKATHLKFNFHFAPSTKNFMLLESYLNWDSPAICIHFYVVSLLHLENIQNLASLSQD